jgi:hypothetical protein
MWVNTGSEMVVVYSSGKAFAKKFSLTSLPVKLLSFEANYKNQEQVSLNWQTASENNNNYFTVSKSKDGKTFVQLNTVKSKENTGSSYQTVDFSPYEGTIYYKLTQTDLDGKTEELGIRTVKVKTLKEESFNIYPNPVVNGVIHISNTTLTGKQTVEIYDFKGQKLVNDFIFFRNNGAEYKINKSLSKGIYLLNISNQHQTKIIIE